MSTPTDEAKSPGLMVVAVPSLRPSFEALAALFEKAPAGGKVQLAFVEAAQLAAHLQKAPLPDLVAVDDETLLEPLEKKHLIKAPVAFAANEPVVVVPRGNPGKLERLIDLLQVKRLAVGTPKSAVGVATKKLVDRAGRKFGGKFAPQFEKNVSAHEVSGPAVVAKVATGKADAGVAFLSDTVAVKDKVDVVRLPPAMNAVANCPIAILTKSHQPALAQAWIDFLISSAGQQKLNAAGFAPVVAMNATPTK